MDSYGHAHRGTDGRTGGYAASGHADHEADSRIATTTADAVSDFLADRRTYAFTNTDTDACGGSYS